MKEENMHTLCIEVLTFAMTCCTWSIDENGKYMYRQCILFIQT